MANPRKRKAAVLEALRKAAQEQSPSPKQFDELVEKARELVKMTEQLTAEQIEQALNIKEIKEDGEKEQTVEERKEIPTKNPEKSKPTKKRARKRTTKSKK